MTAIPVNFQIKSLGIQVRYRNSTEGYNRFYILPADKPK